MTTVVVSLDATFVSVTIKRTIFMHRPFSTVETNRSVGPPRYCAKLFINCLSVTIMSIVAVVSSSLWQLSHQTSFIYAILMQIRSILSPHKRSKHLHGMRIFPFKQPLSILHSRKNASSRRAVSKSQLALFTATLGANNDEIESI